MSSRCILGGVLFTLSSLAFALDPIAWSLDQPLANPLPAGTHTVTYTFRSQLPYPLARPIVIEKAASPASEFTYVDGCTGLKLTPQQTCTVSITHTPQSFGSKWVQLTIAGYDNNRVPLPILATARGNNGNNCLTASASLPLPTDTFQYADNIVQFTFTNTCSTTQSLPTVNIGATLSGGGMVTVTTAPIYDTCSNRTVATGQSCTIKASIIPQETGQLTVTGSVSSGTGTVQANTTATVAAPGYTHRITFINQCPFNVWYGAQSPDPTPNPSPDAYLLTAQVVNQRPATKALSIPATPDGYRGNLFPRTGCRMVGSNFVCSTGDCKSTSNAQCTRNGTEPMTRIEQTFPTATTQGTYDISLTNGISIPVEFKAFGPATSVTTNPQAPFICSGAGAPIQPPPPSNTQPLAACSWMFNPTNLSQNMHPELFNFVSSDVPTTSCSACSGSQVCGLAYATPNLPGTNITTACGKLLGYLSITQSCSDSYTNGSSTLNPHNVFSCENLLNVDGYPNDTTYYNLYSCTPNDNALQSCYQGSTGCSGVTGGMQCCGARDWNAPPYITAQDSTSQCTNPNWTDIASPLTPSPLASILWIKEGCPTAYAYPYDDHSASFVCNYSDADQTNSVAMDYEIVFCPGGITGNVSLNP